MKLCALYYRIRWEPRQIEVAERTGMNLLHALTLLLIFFLCLHNRFYPALFCAIPLCASALAKRLCFLCICKQSHCPCPRWQMSGSPYSFRSPATYSAPLERR